MNETLFLPPNPEIRALGAARVICAHCLRAAPSEQVGIAPTGGTIHMDARLPFRSHLRISGLETEDPENRVAHPEATGAQTGNPGNNVNQDPRPAPTRRGRAPTAARSPLQTNATYPAETSSDPPGPPPARLTHHLRTQLVRSSCLGLNEECSLMVPALKARLQNTRVGRSAETGRRAGKRVHRRR